MFVKEMGEKLKSTSYSASTVINFDETLMSVIEGKVLLSKVTDSMRNAGSANTKRLNTAGSFTPS